MMARKKHLLLGDDFVRTYDYASKGVPIEQVLPERDPDAHAQLLNETFSFARSLFERKKADFEDHVADGIYVDALVKKGINFDNLNLKTAIKLMNVHEGDQGDRVTLYIPANKAEWLPRKIEKYADPLQLTSKKQRKGAKLLNYINQFEETQLMSFFPLGTVLEEISDEYARTYEVWVRNEGNSDGNETKTKIQRIGIHCYEQSLLFEEVRVFCVKAKRRELYRLMTAIDKLSEIRLGVKASVLTHPASFREGEEWLALLDELIQRNTDTGVRVGILDTGVNNEHLLLKGSLPGERRLDVIGTDGRDRWANGHGTLMAGLALFGDLSQLTNRLDDVVINHDLTSIKMVPGRGEPVNERDMYGVITEDALLAAEATGASITCMAVTSEEEEPRNGQPSSWSAAIDKVLYYGGKNRLLFVSAGNVCETSDNNYPFFNEMASLLDPAQSWNAITVGAYTERCVLGNQKDAEAHTLLATVGGLSPYSRTSMKWSNKSMIKPDIVMEGGNAFVDDSFLMSHDDCALVTTGAQSLYRSFVTINATSASTALAARLAAQIKTENTSLSMLSIRALIVHAASWTNEMHRQSRGSLDWLLKCCGYGVPDETRSLNSSQHRVTFITEQRIEPYVKGDSGRKLGRMHLIELPWPKDLLLSLENLPVKLKVTLSYYVAPAPGRTKWINTNQYQSVGLRYDVNTEHENKDEFVQRISHISDEFVDKTDNNPQRWKIGIKRRNRGSIHSDWIEESASSLASCQYIAVYPVNGWWSKHKKEQLPSLDYSLVVTLETPDEQVDLYTTIQTIIHNMVAVQV